MNDVAGWSEASLGVAESVKTPDSPYILFIRMLLCLGPVPIINVNRRAASFDTSVDAITRFDLVLTPVNATLCQDHSGELY